MCWDALSRVHRLWLRVTICVIRERMVWCSIEFIRHFQTSSLPLAMLTNTLKCVDPHLTAQRQFFDMQFPALRSHSTATALYVLDAVFIKLTKEFFYRTQSRRLNVLCPELKFPFSEVITRVFNNRCYQIAPAILLARGNISKRKCIFSFGG